MNVAKPLPADKLPKKPKLVTGKKLVRFACSALLAGSDVVTISIVFFVGNALYPLDLGYGHAEAMLSALLPIYVGLMLAQQGFDVDGLETPWGGAARAVPIFMQAAVAVLSMAYFLKTGSEFSRAVFGSGAVGSLVLLPFSRAAMRWVLVARVLGGSPYTVVVIRDMVPYEATQHEIVVTPEELNFDPTASDPFQFNALSFTIAEADRLIVACPQERYVLWSTILKSMTVSGEILTDERDHLGIIGIGQQGDRQTMIVATGSLRLGQRVVKRAVDLLIALAGLLILLPLLVVTGIAIRRESRGPVLFRQERIGRDNRIFRIYKFRSMFAEASDARAEQLTTRNDSRVTKVGEFIRRTSIDELPQLLNVLRGEMSIVGPRPHPLGAKAADVLYWDVDPRYRHRHSIKPGLTGLAQVRGFRGNTERLEDLTNRLQADLEYALNWSLWRDLRIIGRTVFVVRHHNAF